MAQTYSFDIVSEYDVSELDHALDQARREITQRYDFKGTPAAIDYADEKHQAIKISGNSDYQLEAILDILRKKLAKRGQPQNVVDTSQKPEAHGAVMHWNLLLQSGLDQAKAKDLSKKIRREFPKIKVQIQGESLRVSSQSKNDLQAVMQYSRGLDLPYPLAFDNFR